MNFNSIGRSSNFSQAGKSAADETVRAFAASRRNSPKFGELAQKAANLRSEEKIAAIKAEMEVAKAGITAKTNVTTTQIETDADMKLKGAKRKAGALAAAGQLFATAGNSFGETGRTKREVGAEDSFYDSQIKRNSDKLNSDREKLKTFEADNSSTTNVPSNTGGDNTGGTASSSVSATSGGGSKPISSFQASGKTGKYTVGDMAKLAEDAGFTPEQAKVMGAIGFAESGGRAGIDTVQSGLDPNKTNEFSVGCSKSMLRHMAIS